MVKRLVPLAAVLALSASALAFAQTPATPPPAAPTLSAEDQNAAPFPPGPNAALVNKVCTECHSASRVLDLRYTREDAESFYKNMVSMDVETEQAKKIIEYLSTALKA